MVLINYAIAFFISRGYYIIQVAKERIKNSFSHKLLKSIVIGGVVLIAVTNPYFGIRAIEALQKDLKRKNWRKLKNSLYYLRSRGAIEAVQMPDGSFTVTATATGKKIAEKYDLENIKIIKPDQWDGYWRILSFDIPANKKLARQTLLAKLKELGFVMLQKSIWVHPFDCRKELAVITTAFEVEPYVNFIVARELDKSYKVRREFEIRNQIKLD